ncbi:U-box domain-containing protein 19-like [Phragmites australis]|uniref:U-box domain-containing protein 19-like n=1 Tax=Phragmites australis TaxID=29695 RepID=UPI002D774043|nr:U-box domain-containing protein 19-like [Phragmites australis]
MPAPHERGPQRRRRVLALSAVCPCEAISPAPLLASLVSLAADVAGRHDVAAFPALRSGAREAVRLAGVLLAFLEAVRDAAGSADVPLPSKAVLGLSELHVALQKLRFLLADCARRGARLWVLMNAELVASELRVVLGSVATAMDALPRDVVGASDEAGELGRMVSEQAWRAAVRPDAEDERAARSVRSVLAWFGSGVTPGAEDAKLVLGRVGIASWSDCSEEAAFLEAELLERLEAGGENDNDLVLISGLMAFLVYCSVVLFDRMDSKKADAAAPVTRPASCAAWINPEALQCPITLELMTDPVTVATGQTYDRASINKWIKNGCRKCPVTGERLRNAEVVPNVAVRGVIEQLLLSKGASLHEPSSKHRCAVDKTAAPFGAVSAGGVRLAVAFLIARLSRGTPEEQKKATYEVRKLSKRNVFYRACLVEADAVPWLLHLLSSTDASVQGNAVAGLLNLSKHPAGRRALMEAGGPGLIVDAVNVAAKVEARQNAAGVLFYLSSNPKYCEEISRIPEAIPTLVHLVREGAYRGRKNALVSLYGLLQCVDGHGKAVSAGAVAVVAGLLSAGGDRGDDLALDAIALLARLAEQPAGARAVVASSALVTRLVDFLGEEASRSAKEHCVALLASLGRHGGDKVLALLGKLPGLMPALYALIADGSPQAGKKARWLVNEIHRHYEQRQPPSAAPAPLAAAGDRIVRV